MTIGDYRESNFTVLDRANVATAVGARMRRRVGGPESDLLGEFLHNITIELAPGHRATVFREPVLECGAPDLVLAIWHSATAERWARDRASLKSLDLRLAQFLYCLGTAKEEELKARYPSARSSLERLAAAGVARCTRDIWKLVPLNESFAVRRLIAIEAKVSDWTAVVEQARRNRWFACESHVLLPRNRGTRNRLVHKPKGTRVLFPDGARIRVNKVPSSAKPRSYVSWLFNEWVWRDAFSCDLA